MLLTSHGARPLLLVRHQLQQLSPRASGRASTCRHAIAMLAQQVTPFLSNVAYPGSHSAKLLRPLEGVGANPLCSFWNA